MQANVVGRAGGGGGIFKTAAVTVLREEKRLMSTGARFVPWIYARLAAAQLSLSCLPELHEP